METNLQFRLAARPVGMVKDSDWQQAEEPLRPLADGEIRVKVLYLSLDPAMRGWMNEGKSYIRPVAIGEVMRAGGVGVVVESKSPRFAVGDHVSGGTGVQRLLDRRGRRQERRLLQDRSQAGAADHLPQHAGHARHDRLLRPARIGPAQGRRDRGGVRRGRRGRPDRGPGRQQLGCRVVGIAGGKDKCDFVVNQLGFDACIDYKNDSVKDGLKQHCPQGVDVYFDNVGGEILDTVLTRINLKARIVICGAISQYNNTTPVKGPSNYLSLLVNRARMEGIVVFDYADRYHLGVAALAGWMKEGKLKSKEDVVQGLEHFPQALNMLFEGKNFGKLVLQAAA
jgi:NADPH-dependent curcumin reductase CurA